MNVVGGRIVRKPCYGLAEICERWGVTESDVANFVAANELTLSVVVAGLAVEKGSIEDVNDRDWCHVPDERSYLSGAADLHQSQAWATLMNGSETISSFKAEPGRRAALVDHLPRDRPAGGEPLLAERWPAVPEPRRLRTGLPIAARDGDGESMARDPQIGTAHGQRAGCGAGGDGKAEVDALAHLQCPASEARGRRGYSRRRSNPCPGSVGAADAGG